MKQQIKFKKQHKKYPEYKDAGVEWLNNIPSEWVIYKLKHICHFQSGDGFPDKLQGASDEEIPFFKVSDINGEEREVKEAINYVSKEAIAENSWHLVPRCSVLLAKIGAALSKNHRKVSLVESCIDNNMLAVSSKPPLSSDFLFWLWLNIDATDFQNVSSVPSINMNMLRNHFCPLPNEVAQERIATYLDQKSTLIDQVIDKKKKLIELLKEKRAAVINQAVTKGLDPDAKTKPSGMEWLGDIPKHWRALKLKFIGESIIGLTYSPDETSLEGTIVLRASNVRDGKIVLDDNVYVDKDIKKRLIVRDGDILICSRSGSRALIGKCALIEKAHEGHSFGAFMTVFRSKFYHYLYYVFNSVIFSFHIESFITSTINQLISSNLNNIIVPLPPIGEQLKIASFLKEKIGSIDLLVCRVEESIKLLQEYKTSLISHVVTGKVRVQG